MPGNKNPLPPMSDEPPEFEDPREGGPTNGRNSKVSGGGGERDLKHSHDDAHRSSKGDRDA